MKKRFTVKRDIESDLEGLKFVFDLCFDRNMNGIPEYTGQERSQVSTLDQFFNIQEQLNGKGYEYHIENGRSLVDILLSNSWKLGYDLCMVTKVSELEFITSLFSAVNSDKINSIIKDVDVCLKSTQSYTSDLTIDGLSVGVINSIITMLMVLEGLTLKGTETKEALKDLKSNKFLKKIIE